MSKQLRLKDVDLDKRIGDRKDYEAELTELQTRMLRVQQAYWRQKRRAIIVFEGWDASGKGGAIRRLTELLDPRGCKVWPIAAPTEVEQGKHYLWRFWERLPERGTIGIFDRSWYGRVLVERVEGFAKKETWKRAFDEINEFERLLTDDGARIVKIFIHIDQEEQLRRFVERLTNPYKVWKLTSEDIRNRSKWKDYSEAINDMFAETSTKTAPWYAIPGNNKWYCRLKTLRVVTAALAEGVDLTPPGPNPALLEEAATMLGLPDLPFMLDKKILLGEKKKKKKKKDKKDK
ncbi:MAG: polyphosphate kinase [Alphaproteobacteria bacterium]|nr:polyphosphate kinase [Alphaproteobacteria bacterium]